MNGSTRNRAFTLIELLIVVAIIAILAAIAVPNFMEAQTRSKIARCKADQRSLATAIEAYTVDYNRPPLSFRFWATSYEGDKAGLTTSFGAGRARAIASFTTPVAYISSFPEDPFVDKAGTFWQIEADEDYGNLYSDQNRYYRYEDFVCHWWADASTSPEALGNTASAQARLLGYNWAVGSPGPTRYDYINMVNALRGKITHSAAGRELPTYFPYDPTNGTLSEGLIVRTNQGVWDQLRYDKAQEL